MGGYAKFLRKKGWRADVVGKVNDAIQFLIKNKPNFVFISQSHPSPKIPSLHTLLKETFNCTPIVFGESYDTLTIQRLNTTKCKFVMRENPSGPSLYRRLIKIMKDIDEEKEHQQTIDNLYKSTDQDPSAISQNITTYYEDEIEDPNSPLFIPAMEDTILSDEIPFDQESTLDTKSDIEISSHNVDDIKNNDSVSISVLKQIESNELDSSLLEKSDDTKQNSQIILQKGKKNKKTSIIFQDSSEIKNSESLKSSSANSNKTANPIEHLRPKDRKDQQTDTAKNPRSKDSYYETQHRTYEEQGHLPIEDSNQNKIKNQFPWERHRKDQKKLKSIREQLPPEKAQKIEKVAQEILDKKRGIKNRPLKEPARPQPYSKQKLLESINNQILNTLNKSIISAVDQSVESVGIVQYEILDHIFIQAFPVYSEKMNGVLILASSQDLTDWPDLLPVFTTRLQMEFDQNFQGHFSLGPPLNVHVNNINFATWSKKLSIFSFHREHESVEIGVAFFPNDSIVNHPYPVINGYAEIKVDYLVPGKNIDFPVYLHLEKNNKFYKYVNKDRSLDEKQKEKLKSYEIEVLHIKKDDITKHQNYLISNFLNQLIYDVIEQDDSMVA